MDLNIYIVWQSAKGMKEGKGVAQKGSKSSRKMPRDWWELSGQTSGSHMPLKKGQSIILNPKLKYVPNPNSAI